MTLKQFLTENKITSTNDQRMSIGKIVARIWDCSKMGTKITVQEDDYTVRDYPIDFLLKKGVIKNIIKNLE